MLERVLRKIGFRDREWGDWHTTDDRETPRYSLLSTLIAKHAQGVPLLDLGCSTGPLLKHLPPDLPYLGIDCQSDALARVVCRPNQRVVCGDISDHSLHQGFAFGCVVFSEVLYYQPTTKTAMSLVKSYATLILPPKIAIVSVWISHIKVMPKNASVLEAITTHCQVSESHFVPHASGGWHVLVLHL